MPPDFHSWKGAILIVFKNIVTLNETQLQESSINVSLIKVKYRSNGVMSLRFKNDIYAYNATCSVFFG
jgi:hypothetical protein